MVETAYVNEAARAVTAAMVSRGERPSVISALMKYQTTERMRRSVNDAMDIHGGRAICDGPTNYLQSAYQMVPVGITVEGANILTRTLITFAQGALRSHPYLYKEIQAAQDTDEERGLDAFDDGVLRPHRVLALERDGRASSTTSRAALFGARAGAAPAALPHWYRQLGAPVAQLRLRRRLDGRAARRRPQDQAEDHRPPGRRAVRALHALLRAEALRGRRPPGRRRAHRRARRRRTASTASRRRCAASSTTSRRARRAG